MEKEYKVVGPKNISEPLKDVTIEYNGQPYVVSFEYDLSLTIALLEKIRPPFYENLKNTVEFASIRNDL